LSCAGELRTGCRLRRSPGLAVRMAHSLPAAAPFLSFSSTTLTVSLSSTTLDGLPGQTIEAFCCSGLRTFFKRAQHLRVRPLPGRMDVSGFRLTVARRRRIFPRGRPGRNQRTVFPNTKSAVNVVCGTAPQGWGERENCRNIYERDNTVTRGRPFARISTLKGVWKTC
jgi:hypothetical protein